MHHALLRGLLPAAVLVGLAFAPLAGQAAPATETRSVPEFSAIAAGGSVNISVTQGSVTSVQLTADEKELPHIETVVETGKRGATLQPPSLQMSISGSGNAVLSGLSTDEFDLSIAGSGDVVYSGEASVKSSVAGSGAVKKR